MEGEIWLLLVLEVSRVLIPTRWAAAGITATTANTTTANTDTSEENLRRISRYPGEIICV